MLDAAYQAGEPCCLSDAQKMLHELCIMEMRMCPLVQQAEGVRPSAQRTVLYNKCTIGHMSGFLVTDCAISTNAVTVMHQRSV